MLIRLSRPLRSSRAGGALLVAATLTVVAAMVWQAVTAAGAPDPTSRHLTPAAVAIESGVLVFREGLESVLVLAAVTASFPGAHRGYRRPVAAGVGLAFLATAATWVVAAAALGAVGAPELSLQAATGLLAVAVLLVVMNWFFHKVYWTGWIAHHGRRRRHLLELAAAGSAASAAAGFVLLGFTSAYREGVEVVLFLQNLRLQAGSGAVLQGVLVGLFLTAVVGVVTFAVHGRLPYRRMLVLTGVTIGAVLVVMVGESAQEMQLAGWIPTTNLALPLPAWTGVWFALFPTAETLTAQALAAAVVIGSYFAAEHVRVRRPRRLAEASSAGIGTSIPPSGVR
jgi:high-affinity iron transporter